MSLSTLTRLTLVGFSASVLGLLAALPAGALSLLGTQTQSFGLDANDNVLRSGPGAYPTNLTGAPLLTFDKYSGTKELVEADVKVIGYLSSQGNIFSTQATSQTVRRYDINAVAFDLDSNNLGGLSFDATKGMPTAIVPISKTQNITITPVGTPLSNFALAGSGQPGSSVPYNGTTNSINGPTTAYNDAASLGLFLGSAGDTFSFAPTTDIQVDSSTAGGNVGNDITTFAGAKVIVSYYAVPFEFSPFQGFALGVPLFFGLRGFKKRLARKSGASKAAVAA